MPAERYPMIPNSLPLGIAPHLQQQQQDDPPVPGFPDQGPTWQPQPSQVSPTSYNTLRERAQNLESIITNQESQLVELTSQRARIGDASFMDKVRSVSSDLKNRKEHYARLVNFLDQVSQHNTNGMPLPPPQNGMQAGPSQPQPPFPIPPLDKARFDTLYKNFCAQRSIVHNAQLMSLEARLIDLCDLHTQVMLEGGGANVAQKDLWSVVGGRMGFVAFPASDTESAKSGPGVAQHLAHVYKEYLAGFDHVYVFTVMKSRQKNDAMARMGGAGAMGAGGANGAPQLPMRGGISDPTQLRPVMAYANIPLVELRRRGIPEQLIQFIENNRATLLRNASEQGIFRNQIARPPDQGGMQHPSAPFAGSPPPGNRGMMQPMGRPFMQRPGMPGPGNPIENQGQGLQLPTRETLQAAMSQITKLKTDYSPERMLSNVPMIDVPAEQRMEYNTVLEQLHRACMDLDQTLPMLYAILQKEDVVRRLVIIIQTAVQQQAMISNGSTCFLVTLDTLRTMLNQVLHMNESYAALLQGLLEKQQPTDGIMQLPNESRNAFLPNKSQNVLNAFLPNNV